MQAVSPIPGKRLVPSNRIAALFEFNVEILNPKNIQKIDK